MEIDHVNRALAVHGHLGLNAAIGNTHYSYHRQGLVIFGVGRTSNKNQGRDRSEKTDPCFRLEHFIPPNLKEIIEKNARLKTTPAQDQVYN